MPVYEYQCTECGEIKEVFQKFSDSPLTTCALCKGSFKKLISQSTFHLKGSGWYVTDYGGVKRQKNKNSDNIVSTNAKESKESKTASKKTNESKV